MGIIKIKPKKVDNKKINESIEFAKALIDKEIEGAEAYLITIHVIRATGKGKKTIFHNFNYLDFPTGDWGKCMVAIGSEARRAELVAQTGAAKV